MTASRFFLPLSALFFGVGLAGCVVSGVDPKLIEQCTTICAAVDTCGADAPAVSFWGTSESSDIEGLDCLAACSQEDSRAAAGYSDCQLECLEAAAATEPDVCGAEMDACWDVSSESYASYCLSGRETTPVAPSAEDPEPTNGTTTGNSTADDIVDNPAVEAAVEGAAGDGFVVNFGDAPPDIVGLFHAEGTIDSSSNARPVGSIIDTTLCFSNPTPTDEGTNITYCEFGVPGTDTAPITGSGKDFTIYLEYPGAATVLFSGSVDDSGNPTNVEALVVYLSGVDIWELSHTDWTNEGTCDTCE